MHPTLHHAQVDGQQIAYRRRGKGAPVLLLHGVASTSFLWEGIIERLEDRYDLIAPDLLGCGESSKPSRGDCSIDRQASLMLSLVDQLGLEGVHLVGHDIGGGAAQLLAVRAPERFADLCLVNTVGYDHWPVQPITTMRLPVFRSLASAGMRPELLRLVVRRGLYHKERLTDEVMAELWRPLSDAAGLAGFFQLLKGINNRFLTQIADDLRTLPLRTLVIRGDADAYLSRRIAERLAADIPNVRLEVVACGGHFIQLDEPGVLASLLGSFFEETEAGTRTLEPGASGP